MNPIDSKLKKILAMIDGATSEGEAKAASLALQRLLAANNMTLEDIDLTDDAPEVNESAEELGKRVPEWVKARVRHREELPLPLLHADRSWRL